MRSRSVFRRRSRCIGRSSIHDLRDQRSGGVCGSSDLPYSMPAYFAEVPLGPLAQKLMQESTVMVLLSDCLSSQQIISYLKLYIANAVPACHPAALLRRPYPERTSSHSNIQHMYSLVYSGQQSRSQQQWWDRRSRCLGRTRQ